VRTIPLGGAALLALFAGACGDSVGPNATGRVVFHLAGQAGAPAPGAARAVTVTDGVDVLVITNVEVVARKLKLERADGSCPPSDPASDGDDVNTDDCPVLWLPPRLLVPSLNGGATALFAVDLPAGTYTELKVQIHKPTNSSRDAEFLVANPDFLGTSIRVTGTLNGEPFVFTTDLTTVVEVELEEPVVVTEDAPVSLTLAIDVGAWFLAADGVGILDPRAAGQQTRSRIEQNIRESFHAFEDDDEDGAPDD
jgi:hypothetical protein